MRVKWLVLLVAFFSIAAFYGCGSSGSGGSDVADSDGGTVSELGSISCSACHSGGSTYLGKVFDLWLATTHGNPNVSPDGHDPIADPDDSCVPCHAGPDFEYTTYGNAIGCERCHGGGSAHKGVGPLPEAQPSPEVCLECHGLTESLRHGGDSNRQIFDTHYDDPTTYDTIIDDPGPPIEYEYESFLEGYIVRTGKNSGCYECHDAHNTDLTINREWGRSSHAGYILDVKDAVALDEEDVDPDDRYDAVLTEAGAGAFIHGGWSGSCQRCHTSTGVSNFLDDPYGYDSDNNDWSHFATGQQDGRQDELIYCWACHTNGYGGMRQPNVEDFPIYDRNNDISGEIDVADAGNSIVCVPCHAGRANGEYIRNTAAGSRSGSGRIHYRASAGTLYAADIHTGYEFDLDGDTITAEHYDDTDLEHHEINEGLGQAGPCASCHMPDASHYFASVEKAGGMITVINNQALCDSCHGGAVTEVELQALSDQYQNALRLLYNTVTDVEPNYNSADFSSSTVLRRQGDGVDGQNDYGASQNYQYLNAEPGAFAHNSLYAKRIIFDSLNWLQDGELSLDGTVDIPASYKGASLWFLGVDGGGEASRPEAAP